MLKYGVCFLFIFYGIDLLNEMPGYGPVAVISASVRSFWAKWGFAF